MPDTTYHQRSEEVTVVQRAEDRELQQDYDAALDNCFALLTQLREARRVQVSGQVCTLVDAANQQLLIMASAGGLLGW